LKFSGFNMIFSSDPKLGLRPPDFGQKINIEKNFFWNMFWPQSATFVKTLLLGPLSILLPFGLIQSIFNSFLGTLKNKSLLKRPIFDFVWSI